MLASLSLLIAVCLPALAAGGEHFAYIGAYSGPQSKGIYVYRFQPATGELTSLGLAGEANNPSFLAIRPGGEFLYAVEETDGGSVSAFRIDRASGKLTRLNRVSSHGAGPCALAVDHTGKYVLVSNYSSGSVALLPIKADGSLGDASSVDQHKGAGVNRERQEGPHAHSADFSPDNRFALACDLGTDEVVIYKFDAAAGKITRSGAAKLPPGSGPRHLAFHPDGKLAYVVSELTATVASFSWDAATGSLKQVGIVNAYPPDYHGQQGAAEVQVHPNGKFVYASNREQANHIAVFAAAPAGTLKTVEIVPSGGKAPRYFGFDPSGAWLLSAHQDSDNIVVFRVDPATGKLTPSKTIQIHAPVCVKFTPAK